MGRSWTKKPGHRSINLLLIATLLLSTVIPAHYHLHHTHSHDPAGHEHTIDLHLVTDNSGQSHHDEDTSFFAATPDVIVKKVHYDAAPFLLMAIILVLTTVFNRIAARSAGSHTRTRRQADYFSPPLRAPPRHQSRSF